MLQCFGGGEHGLLGLTGVAAIDQHVAGQPVELAEKGTHLRLFLPMLTVRFGTTLPST